MKTQRRWMCFHNLSLRNKIFVVFALFLILITSFGVTYFTSYAVKITNSQIEESFRSSVYQSSNAFAQHFQNGEQIGALVAQNHSLIQLLERYGNASTSQKLDDYREMSRILQSAEDVEGSNVRLYTPEPQLFLNDNLNLFPFTENLQERLEAGLPMTGWVEWNLTDLRTGFEYPFQYLCPIYSRTQIGKLLAVVTVGVSEKQLEAAAEGLRQLTVYPLQMVSQSGKPLYGGDDLTFLDNWPSERLRESGSSYDTRNFTAENTRVLQIIQRVGNLPYYLSACFPQTTLTENLRQVWASILAVAVIAVLLTLIIAYYVSRSMSERVGKLTAAMQNYSVGQPYMPLEPKYEDDIGLMIRNYNQLVTRTEHLVAQVYLADVKEKDARLRFLQAQINPHFLYNTLNVINCLAMEDRTREIQVLIPALSNFFRLSLREEKSNPLGNELAHAASYVEICRYRFGERVRFLVDVEECYLGIPVPCLSLQPLVENSLLHGMRQDGAPLELRITAKACDSLLLLELRDNGLGMPSEKLESLNRSLNEERTPTAGIGVQNVHQRLQLMYGADYGLNILSQPDLGTRCIITLPLHGKNP